MNEFVFITQSMDVIFKLAILIYVYKTFDRLNKFLDEQN